MPDVVAPSLGLPLYLAFMHGHKRQLCLHYRALGCNPCSSKAPTSSLMRTLRPSAIDSSVNGMQTESLPQLSCPSYSPLHSQNFSLRHPSIAGEPVRWHADPAGLPLVFALALQLLLPMTCPPASSASASEAEKAVDAPPAAQPGLLVGITVTVRGGADLQALGPAPTLFLTARTIDSKMPFLPFASRKVRCTLHVKGLLENALHCMRAAQPIKCIASPPVRYEVRINANSSVPPFLQDVVDLSASPGAETAFPRDVTLGERSGDLLVPPDQYGALSELLDGVDVVVSARLDRDGDANTRDAEDLVGRGVAVWNKATHARGRAAVSLEGRGLFGKFVTTRS